MFELFKLKFGKWDIGLRPRAFIYIMYVCYMGVRHREVPYTLGQ